MSTTVNKSTLSGIIRGMKTTISFDDWYDRPEEAMKLRLERIGKKRYIVKRQFGAALMTYKCSYPEARRRFALLVITNRLLGQS